MHTDLSIEGTISTTILFLIVDIIYHSWPIPIESTSYVYVFDENF